MQKIVLLAVLACSGLSAQAQTSFLLRNVDPASVFYYWTVTGPAPQDSDHVLPGLPLAPGGRHGVAPGERVKVNLGPGASLVGVFVPWTENLSFRTLLFGGWVLAPEVPQKGTLQVNRISFAAANRGRSLDGLVQDWGLSVPQYVLDGQFSDWTKVKPLVEWGPAFFQGTPKWPGAWPKPLSLQAVDREGALWVHMSSDKPWSVLPVGSSVYLVLRRPGATLGWPLSGSDGTVWSWTEGADPSQVGSRIVQGADVEAWVPWDRIPEKEKKAWTLAKASWGLVVTDGETTRTIDLAPTSLGEWP